MEAGIDLLLYLSLYPVTFHRFITDFVVIRRVWARAD